MHGEVGVSCVGFNVFEGVEFAEGVLEEVDVIVVVETDNLGVVVGACVELSHFP